jgi:hypothetical protein
MDDLTERIVSDGAPLRHDGIPRLTVELTQAQAEGLWQYAFAGAGLYRATGAPLVRSTVEDADRGISILITALLAEGGMGGDFDEPNREE